MVSVTYTNKRRDAMASAAYLVTHSWFNLAFIVVFVLVTLAPTIGDLGPQLALGEKVLITVITEMLLVAAVFAFGAAVTVLTILVHRQPGVYEQHTLTADADNLRETTSVNDTIMSWSAVRKIARTPFHIFIFVGPNAGHIIPYRDIGSEEEWHSLYDSLVALWSENKRPACASS